MHIAVIIKSLNVLGGTQRHVLAVAREWILKGHDVTLYTFDYTKGEGFADKIEQFRVVSMSSISTGERKRNLLGKFGRFLLFMQNEHANAKAMAQYIDLTTDVLNPHQDALCVKVAYYYKKKRRNIPSVWMLHDLNTKYSSFIRAHAMNPHLTLSFIKRIAYGLCDTWDKYYVRAQDVIVVLDTRDQDLVKKYFGRNALIIPNGIDVAQFPYVAHEPPLGKEQEIHLLMIGIFFAHRRFEDTLDAVHQLKVFGYHPKLTIIGDIRDKEYYNAIIARIHALHIADHIVLRGKVSEQELLAAYREHDIFIFPSHLQSWGLVVSEALASGLPVIVSRTSGIADVLTHGIHAWIVNPKSPEEIASAIKHIIYDAALYCTLSQHGRQFVETSLTWSACAEKFLACFEEAMKK